MKLEILLAFQSLKVDMKILKLTASSGLLMSKFDFRIADCMVKYGKPLNIRSIKMGILND